MKNFSTLYFEGKVFVFYIEKEALVNFIFVTTQMPFFVTT